MGKVLVLDAGGKPRSRYPAALCRKLLRRKQAKVYSYYPFVLILVGSGQTAMVKN